MFYRIGLDIGIASVGWCVVLTDEAGEPVKILDLNTRVFEAAEQPKSGASLAEPRRLARGLRRRTRRKAHRLERAKQLFSDCGIDITPNPNVNIMRVSALDNKISESDFANVLLLLIKRRGFKSNRIHDKKGENGLLLQATEKNRQLMKEKGYRTVGELVYNEYRQVVSCKKGDKVICLTRNEERNYDKTVLRSELENEIKILFSRQKTFGNTFATEENEKKILEIFNSQRNFDEGPGVGSKYSANYDVGYCQFENGERRAPKASFSFERAVALQKLNNLMVVGDREKRNLTESERNTVLELIEKHKEIKFSQIRKSIGLSNEFLFNSANYNSRTITKTKRDDVGDLTADEIIAKAETSVFISTKQSKEIINCLNEDNKANIKLIDKIAEVLTIAKSDSKRLEKFTESGLDCLSDDEISKLLALTFSKYGHLSFKALYNILPYLEEGQKYSDACKSAGYNHSEKENIKTELLNSKDIYDEINTITSPVVKRAVSQALKVLNAIIRKYGSPLAINIELAREMSKSRKDRDKESRENKKRFEINQKAKEELSEKFNIKAKTLDLIKYRLYEEQNGKCIYSGLPIDVNRLFEPNYVQIDHIIPYSRSFDDSFKNKVLVLANENQNKGNRTPFEWLFVTDRWNEFFARVTAVYSNDFRKKRNLLQESFDENEWKERALNDTRYISRYMLNLISNNLKFETGSMSKKRVFAVNGAITSMIRRQWGINKVREDGDIHHAVDASVVACITDSNIQKLSRIYKNKEKNIDTEKIVPQPYENFTNELFARCMPTKEEMQLWLSGIGYTDEEIESVKPIFVSRMPDRKGTGEINKQTIRSDKYKDDNIVVNKVAITELTLTKDKKEIDKYFNKESDPVTYNVLLNRLQQYNGDATLAFASPVFKPKKDGTQGNQIKKVKLAEKRNLGVEFSKIKGFANNGSMVRVDIFCKDKKFYGVPVYAKDIYEGVLPNKAATSGKLEKDWTEMDDSYEFLFSLYKNDLVKIVRKDLIKLTKCKENEQSKLPDIINTFEEMLYFKSFDISCAGCKLVNHNNCYMTRIGLQTLESIRKYQVDILGNISQVSKEIRHI